MAKSCAIGSLRFALAAPHLYVEQHMRTLLDREIPLMRRLLSMSGRQEAADQLLIDPLADGGMGSFRIGERSPGRKLGHTAAEVTFRDRDGAFVVAALNLDGEGRLFEVDIWKADFSPLQHWPSENEFEPFEPPRG